MPRSKKILPTDSELAILRVLWEHGPRTVRQVNEEINRNRKTGYTTTLKLMQIMHEKGLLVRDTEVWPHVYQAQYQQEQTQSELLGKVLDRAFSGSAEKLVMRLLGSRKVSREELDRIKKMLDEFEGE